MTDERSGGQAREREARGRRRLVVAFAAVILVAGVAAGVVWWTGDTTDLEQEAGEEAVERATPDTPASPTDEPAAIVPETEAPRAEPDEEPEQPPAPTWSRVAHDDDVFGGPQRVHMTGVAAGPAGLVAVGGDEGREAAAVWTSPDGQAWSRVECEGLDASGPQFMRALAEGGPGLVAVGRDDDAGTAAVWTSTDGLAWDRVEDEALARPGTGMQAVTEGAAGLVAVGSDDGDEPGTAAVWIVD